MCKVKEITPVGICKLHEESGNMKMIDVRSKEEFDEVHASIAINIPMDSITPEKIEEAGFSKDDPIYLICRSGARSGMVANDLINKGYKHVYNVTGGTLEWIELGYQTC